MLAHPTKLWRIDTDLFTAHRYGYGANMSARDQHISLAEPQHHVINPTDFCRALDDRIQHWLHICRRTANDTQHFGGWGLMVPGFPAFCGAVLYLFVQPDVLPLAK